MLPRIDSNMKEGSNEKKRITVIMSKRVKFIIATSLVIIVAALGFAVFMGLKPRGSKATSSVIPERSATKEVDIVSLAGFHVGRMVVNGNTTEGPRKAVIDYHLQCKNHTQLNESVLRCDFTLIGCTMVLQDNVTEEECIMADFLFSFEVDEDGTIFTNETDVLDPARLALALYTKHLVTRDYTGEVQQVAVNKTNATYASISLSGLFLEVTELPTDAFNKRYRHPKNNQSDVFLQKHSRKIHGVRRRQTTPLDNILGGAFGRSLKNFWKGGPFIKIPQVFSKSGSFWGVGYNFRLSNLEIMLSTLPDIHVAAIVPPLNSVSQDGYKVKLGADFSLNQQCSDVVASRAHVYFRARACIWFWCFINVRKDDHVSLSFSPKLEITLTLKPRGSSLQYSMALTHLDMASFKSDIGSVDVSLNIGLAIGGALFGPGGFLVGFIVDRILERIAEGIYDDFGRQVPGIVNNMANPIISNLLPPPGVVNNAGAALVAAHMASGVYTSTSLKLLTLELSNIGGLLANAPSSFQPNKIPCSGQGLIQRIHDRCMNDYGGSVSGDSLEIYCYGGAKRFCLSGELCPWRNQKSAACSALFELATCSVGGLGGKDMADAWGVTSHCTRRCRGWWLWRRCWDDCSCSGSAYSNVDCDAGSVKAL